MTAIGILALGAAAACSSSSKPPASASPPSPTNVDAHLLKINDLPTGWSAAPVRGPRASDGRICNAPDPPQAETERIAVFNGAGENSQIAENLYGLASPANAAAAYAFVISHATCTTYTGPDDLITVTLAPVSLPSAGQRSTAWRATVKENRAGITTTGDVILVQDGSYDLSLIDRATTPVATDLMQTTLRKALANLAS
jgi:hypothetical protein